MLGFLKKRRWKEHVKLATQNSLSCKFLFDFEQDAIEAGFKLASPIKSTLETELETAEGYLSDLSTGEPLPTMIANDALDMNRELRSMYDAVLQGRVVFGPAFLSTMIKPRFSSSFSTPCTFLTEQHTSSAIFWTLGQQTPFLSLTRSASRARTWRS